MSYDLLKQIEDAKESRETMRAKQERNSALIDLEETIIAFTRNATSIEAQARELGITVDLNVLLERREEVDDDTWTTSSWNDSGC